MYYSVYEKVMKEIYSNLSEKQTAKRKSKIRSDSNHRICICSINENTRARRHKPFGKRYFLRIYNYIEHILNKMIRMEVKFYLSVVGINSIRQEYRPIVLHM